MRRPVGVFASGRLSNEESFLTAALARSALRTPHLDAGLRRQWEALLYGLGRAGRRPVEALAGIEGSDLVVLLEDDLSVSHPRAALAVLRALRRGARLVTLGWQRTSLSSLASLHIPLDAVAPLASLPGLRANGDLAAWLGASRRAAFVICPFDADAELLRQASAWFGELAAGRADSLLIPLPVRANTRGALDMGVAPGCLAGRRPLDDAVARSMLQQVWGGAGCWDEGADADHMAASVAGLVVVGEDVPAVHPSPARVREQLAALEHLVVVDSFLTETAQRAHVVLPMASFGESEGSLTGLEDEAQPLRPVQPLPADVRQGWQILAELLEALGSSFRPRSLAQVRAAIAAAVPGYQKLAEPASELGWPVAWGTIETLPPAGNGKPVAPAPVPPAPAPAESGGSPAPRLVLRRSGAFDWAGDPLVRFSPALRRDSLSLARRYPQGLVAMNASDAGALGVRDGWTVRLRTPHGEARVGLAVRAGIEPGLVLVPYAFREQLSAVLGADGVAEVEVQPA